MAFYKRKIALFFAFFTLTFAFSLGIAEPRSIEERRSLASVLPERIDFWTECDNDVLAQALVDRMSNEELLAQILMFGWAGAEPSALLNSWVLQRGLGSVKVFGWNTDNITQVARSVRLLQTEAAGRRFKIPLFVATDQEGGWIRHVKGDTSETPGNMAIGASGFASDAYYSGYYINKEIATLGINMNFAPTVDLYTNLESTVIGPRSFGSGAVNAGVLGEAFAMGSLAAGVIPTAKHYPGHGDTSLDSHGRLPEINIDSKTLMSRELIPFRYLIQAGIPAIMSGHLSFPQIEKDGTPASLSKTFLQEILRGELGFKGLIITDDMTMNGATMFAGSLTKAVTMAIEAGNDIVISSSTAGLNDNLWVKNLERMTSVSDFKERVMDAAFRVVYAKLNYFKGSTPAPLFPDESTIYQNIPDKDGQKFFLEQACRSISLLRGGTMYPFASKKKQSVLLAGTYKEFHEIGKKFYPESESYYFTSTIKDDQSNYNEWNATYLLSTAKRYDTVIVCVSDRHSSNIAKRLKDAGNNVIVLSIMSPVWVLDGFEFADTILCGYSYSLYSFKALFAALRGDFVPKGVVPLE